MTTTFETTATRPRHANAGVASSKNLRARNESLMRAAKRDAEELRAARAELDHLAQWISHDLRSPLHVIAGFSDLLLKKYDSKLDEKGAHYLQVIADSTAKVGILLDEILALSRVSRSEIHLVHIELDDLVGRAVRELDTPKGERPISWAIEKMPAVRTDPTLLRQAVTGMLSNALRSTLRCEVARIEVGVRAGERESIFYVRDNATGLDISRRERMFGATHGTAPAAGGAGAIGLTYLKRVVQRLGGRAWAESAPGGGATFLISLPAGDDEREPRGESR
jgi:light-regulated signal transduction histidine kinase (bacteriophytochrome)